MSSDKLNDRLATLVAIAGIIGAFTAIMIELDTLLKTFGHKGIIPVPEEEDGDNKGTGGNEHEVTPSSPVPPPDFVEG